MNDGCPTFFLFFLFDSLYKLFSSFCLSLELNITEFYYLLCCFMFSTFVFVSEYEKKSLLKLMYIVYQEMNNHI